LKWQGKFFFFEKKKQKTFVRFLGTMERPDAEQIKVFGSFFQKRTFLTFVSYWSGVMLAAP